MREVQKLTGCMAALSRFISRLGDRGLPFFKPPGQHDGFKGTEESEEVFKNLKKYLSSPPMSVAPDPQEELLLYIAAGPWALNGVLVVKQEEPDKRKKGQRPVYFFSEV